MHSFYLDKITGPRSELFQKADPDPYQSLFKFWIRNRASTDPELFCIPFLCPVQLGFIPSLVLDLEQKRV